MSKLFVFSFLREIVCILLHGNMVMCVVITAQVTEKLAYTEPSMNDTNSTMLFYS